MIRWIALLAALAFVCAAAGVGCIVILGHIPLLEFDQTISSGSRYGFTIGMTKEEALQGARRQRVNTLTAFWDRTGSPDGLEEFEPRHERGRGRIGRYEVPLNELTALNPALTYSSQWRLEHPVFGINTTDLQFRNDRVVQIRRYRFIVGRP